MFEKNFNKARVKIETIRALLMTNYRLREIALILENEISLSVGDSLFLVSEESSYCRKATIESMEISDRPQEQLQITGGAQKPGFFEKPGF